MQATFEAQSAKFDNKPHRRAGASVHGIPNPGYAREDIQDLPELTTGVPTCVKISRPALSSKPASRSFSGGPEQRYLTAPPLATSTPQAEEDSAVVMHAQMRISRPCGARRQILSGPQLKFCQRFVQLSVVCCRKSLLCFAVANHCFALRCVALRCVALLCFALALAASSGNEVCCRHLLDSPRSQSIPVNALLYQTNAGSPGANSSSWCPHLLAAAATATTRSSSGSSECLRPWPRCWRWFGCRRAITNV